MRIGFELTADGISVRVGGAEYQITYPEEIWRGFEPKHAFAAELVFLQTYGAPIAAGEREVVHDHPRPRFLDRYHDWFRLTLPYLKDRNPSAADRVAPEILARIEREFREERHRPDDFFFPATDATRAVVGLTMGKDSLASLVIGKEMGIDLVGVYAHHSSLANDRTIRIPRLEALGSHLHMPVHVVSERLKGPTNELLGESHPTGMIWSMSVAAHGLLLLPFAHYYRAGLLVLGNEFGLNHPIRLARSGEIVDLSPLQTAAGTSMLDGWIRGLTGGTVGVTSWVHSLHTLACHKLVHSVRPEIGFHQVSCRRSTAADDPRWCQRCGTCAENYLFASAMGRDPATLGFTRTMLDEGSADHFKIVKYGLDEGDPYRYHAARQELLGFHLSGCGREESWMHRHVFGKHGEVLRRNGTSLMREYLEPVDQETPLPMSAQSTAAARRLLGTK